MDSKTKEQEFEDQLRRDFLTEAIDLVATSESELLNLESGESATDSIDTLFRIVHTLKGSAYTVQLNRLGAFVHKVEHILSHLREGEMGISPDLIDVLFKSLDVTKNILNFVLNNHNDDADFIDSVDFLDPYLSEYQSKDESSDSAGFGFFDDEIALEEDNSDSTQSEDIRSSLRSFQSKIKARILVCDDEEDIRDLLSEILKSHDFEAVHAVDGLDGLRELEETDIDLVLTDIKMPNLDGVGFIREIRAQGNRVPILVISGQAQSLDLKHLLNMEIDGYIDKPFQSSDLVVKVNNSLRMSLMRKNVAKISEMNYEAYMAMMQLLLHLGPHVTKKYKDEQMKLEKYLDEIANLTHATLEI